MVDATDWSLCRAFFSMLDARWGPHTCDHFSSDENILFFPKLCHFIGAVAPRVSMLLRLIGVYTVVGLMLLFRGFGRM